MSTVLSPAEPLAPPLKWAGGKRWQLPLLAPFWEQHRDRRLVEPFCGGLAVALGLRPAKALLNDANPHLISFYRWLQRGLDFDVEMRNNERLYYRHRQRFNQLLSSGNGSSSEAAQLFFYLNRTGYNGLCRFNSRGEFNVPFGRYKTINYGRDWAVFRDALADWRFVSGDFETLEFDSSDFVYADPPYDVPFTQYSAGGFAWTDQERTAEVLARHKGPVILVNQATPRILALYKSLGYNAHLVLPAPRRISCTGDRSPAREIIATRNL